MPSQHFIDTLVLQAKLKGYKILFEEQSTIITTEPTKDDISILLYLYLDRSPEIELIQDIDNIIITSPHNLTLFETLVTALNG